MPEIIPTWMLDCLNTIRTWLKSSPVREITITDEGIGWLPRSSGSEARDGQD